MNSSPISEKHFNSKRSAGAQVNDRVKVDLKILSFQGKNISKGKIFSNKRYFQGKNLGWHVCSGDVVHICIKKHQT